MNSRIKVARKSQLRPDQGLTVEVAGRNIALFLHEGRVYAIDDRCPHAGGPLGAGHVTEGVVMCPWHGWRFRVTDGCWIDAPNAGTNVPCYQVIEQGDEIWIDVNW